MNKNEALNEAIYRLRCLIVGDEEETQILSDHLDPEVQPIIDWVLEHIGYTAANVIEIQWLWSTQLKDVDLAEFDEALQSWMKDWYTADDYGYDDPEFDSIKNNGEITMKEVHMELRDILSKVDLRYYRIVDTLISLYPEN